MEINKIINGNEEVEILDFEKELNEIGYSLIIDQINEKSFLAAFKLSRFSNLIITEHYGIGESIDESIIDLCNKISKSTIVIFKDGSRVVISVPKLKHTKLIEPKNKNKLISKLVPTD